MVNVSKEDWKNIRKKLPKNYRMAICKVQPGVTVRQISMVISGESKDMELNKRVKTGLKKVLSRLGYSTKQISEMI
jgi:hypothetical protein